jgi:hypothetical protein
MSAILTNVERRWTSEGPVTTMTWEGIQAEIETLYSQLKDSADSLSHGQSEGPVHNLTATFGNDQDGAEELPDTVWEFPSNDISVDIMTCAEALDLPDALVDVVWAFRNEKVKRTLADPLHGFVGDIQVCTYSGTGNDADIASIDGDTGDVALSLVRAIRAGNESFLRSVPIVRLTTTTSNAKVIQASFALCDKVLLPAKFATDFPPPDDVRAVIPTDVSTVAGWNYGWLVKSPEVAMIGGGRWKIVQEFWWGLHNEMFYPVSP